jgi:succinoglycan biosynthesis transport protein ExoP
MTMSSIQNTDNAMTREFGESDVFSESSLAPIFEKYWQSLKRRFLLIVVIIAAFLAAATIVTLLQTSQYTAVTKIQISRPQKNVVDVRDLNNGNDLNNSEFYDTQYALLKVKSLAERVSNKLNLAGNADFFKAHGIKIENANGLNEQTLTASEKKRRQSIAADLLLKNISIDPIKYSSLVNISYTSYSAGWSAQIANAWPIEFIGAAMDRNIGSTADARLELEKRLEDIRIKLEQSERNLITFGNAHNIITLGATKDASGRTEAPRTLVASNLESLNQALMQARADRIAAESRLGAGSGSANADALGSASLGSLRAKRAELVADRERLLVQFEPAYPAVVAVQRGIDTVDKAIAQENSRYGSAQKSKYVESRQREQLLDAQVSALKGEYLVQQQDTVQYNILQRDVDTNRQLYDALLQRYKDVGVVGTVAVNNVAVVDAAKTPTEPSAPSLPRNLAIALIASLFVCGLVVFVLEQIDEVIRDPAQIEPLLHLPLLGSVPLTEGELVDQLEYPRSDLAEAYFSIQSVMALTTNHGFPKTLEVTSSKPGEGKSITALALATSLGRTGKSVLLVDGDMRSPSVHKLVGSDNAHGLSNMLAGEDGLQPYLQPTKFKGVTVLTSGPLPPSAAELLNSDRLEQVITLMLKDFEHVIFDAPPMLGLADSQLLCRAVEGAVFVIEAQQTSTRAIQRAMQRLRVGTNHVFGVIVTKIDLSKFGSGSDYMYNYDYGKN